MKILPGQIVVFRYLGGQGFHLDAFSLYRRCGRCEPVRPGHLIECSGTEGKRNRSYGCRDLRVVRRAYLARNRNRLSVADGVNSQ